MRESNRINLFIYLKKEQGLFFPNEMKKPPCGIFVNIAKFLDYVSNKFPTFPQVSKREDKNGDFAQV